MTGMHQVGPHMITDLQPYDLAHALIQGALQIGCPNVVQRIFTDGGPTDSGQAVAVVVIDGEKVVIADALGGNTIKVAWGQHEVVNLPKKVIVSDVTAAILAGVVIANRFPDQAWVGLDLASGRDIAGVWVLVRRGE